MKTKHFDFCVLRKQFIFLSCVLISTFGCAQLEFRGVSPAQIAHPFEFTYTSNTTYLEAWGGDIEATGFLLEGELKIIDSDSTGCLDYNEDFTGKIALIYRGDCGFFEKIYGAQQHGAKAVVIVNNSDEPLFFMTGGPTSYLVHIPGLLISKKDGEKLRSAMHTENVQVMLRNMQNYFAYNLSLEKKYCLIPPRYGTPIQTFDKTNPFRLNLGAFVFNRGSSDVANAKLTAKVTAGDEELYEGNNLKLINSEDTLFFELPNFTSYNLSVGKYKLTYTTSILGNEDEDTYSDSATFYFEITEDIISLAPLDENVLPISNHYTTSSNQNLISIQQCVAFENKSGNKIAAEGLYFSVENEGESIMNNEFEISCYNWNHEFNPSTDINSNFNDLLLIDQVNFYMDGDYQNEVFFRHFNQSLKLENNTKYLFCLTSKNNKNVLLGYNNQLDYSLNNFAFHESVHPLQIKTITTQNGNWYNGFADITPSIAVKIIDATFLNLSQFQNLKGNVFPNPLNNQMNIVLETSEEKAELNILDLTGLLILNKEINLNHGTHTLNIEDLEDGMYMVRIRLNSGQSSVFNIIKTN